MPPPGGSWYHPPVVMPSSPGAGYAPMLAMRESSVVEPGGGGKMADVDEYQDRRLTVRATLGQRDLHEIAAIRRRSSPTSSI